MSPYTPDRLLVPLALATLLLLGGCGSGGYGTYGADAGIVIEDPVYDEPC